ncbi:helix-turn-helix domain-containing protein [Leucobacter salsicius]|uniref:helix-turn-helix domain-containing protein n=1 Tax=Leucobacter salsicius TaxID=664638 RepID=UPI00036DEE90|nr:helix-turn-helix transcriptional regulator [Leucobacter salsicius]
MSEAESLDLTESIDANIGANVKKARERLGLSQSEVARLAHDSGMTGFHQTTIARIEKGARSLKAAEAVALARILETSIEYLAESAETARLRGFFISLRERRAAFDEALSGLIDHRLWVARNLDNWLPYGPEGMVPIAELMKANVDLGLYEVLEEVLVNSDPVERFELILSRKLREIRVLHKGEAVLQKPSPKQREQYMVEDLIEQVEGKDGEHPETP